jgi:hypothetical protein
MAAALQLPFHPMLFSPLSDSESQMITGGITFFAPKGIAKQTGPDAVKAVVPANPANGFSEGTNPGIGTNGAGFSGPAFDNVPVSFTDPMKPGFIAVTIN